MKTVLIVDGNAETRLATAELLGRAGYEVLQAETGAGALAIAIEAVPDAVLLDNMPPEMVAEAVRKFGGSVFLEASGGIRLENVEAYARTGVHAVSIGALTHSAAALDISFELLR